MEAAVYCWGVGGGGEGSSVVKLVQNGCLKVEKSRRRCCFVTGSQCL